MERARTPARLVEAIRQAYDMSLCLPAGGSGVVRIGVLGADGSVLAVHEMAGLEQTGFFQDLLRPLGFEETPLSEDAAWLRCALLLRLVDSSFTGERWPTITAARLSVAGNVGPTPGRECQPRPGKTVVRRRQ